MTAWRYFAKQNHAAGIYCTSFSEARGSKNPPEQTYFFAFAQASFKPTVWLNTRCSAVES